MKRTLPPTIFITAALIGVTAVNAAHHAKFTSTSDVEFTDIIPGTVAFATVFGDREKGAHGTFVRVPAGRATPLHTHGAAYNAVIIAGKFENPITGMDNTNVTLSAGSAYSVPAGAKHITRCAADSPVDCMTFFYQDVPFDFAVAE